MCTYEKVLDVAAEILEVGKIEATENDKLINLGLNSIMFIRIVVELENRFDIEFDDDYLDFEKYKTIQDFCNYVDTLLAKK